MVPRRYDCQSSMNRETGREDWYEMLRATLSNGGDVYETKGLKDKAMERKWK